VSETVTTPAVVTWMAAFAAAVAREREHLTELDAAIGDADHGINMERGTQAVLGRIAGAAGIAAVSGGSGTAAVSGAAGDAAATGGLGSLLKTVGMTLVSTVGGAAGPLYGTLFLAMAGTAGARDELTVGEWAATLRAGVAGVQARGKAEPGDKTMLDALLPAVEALDAAAAVGQPLETALRRAAAAAEQGMLATIPLVARKGRASYLGERSAGHQDPGATSSWLLLATAAETLASGWQGGAAP
jgi:phosphoenolpyruvate---glycerone phosphotransferase subunit DhaL